MKDEITLLIPETFITDNQLSDYALATYCSLQSIVVPAKLTNYCTTIQQIIYRLTGNIENLKTRTKMKDYIKCGLNELLENNLIRQLDKIQKHYILDCSPLWIDTKSSRFIVLYYSEVRQIFNIENINNFRLLRYFISLMKTISNKITVQLENGESKSRVIGNLTIDYLSKLSGISKRSIIEYNKALEDNKLLYIYRQEKFVSNKATVKQLPNIYGRASDRKFIDVYALEKKDMYESYTKMNGSILDVNNSRRLAQMYNQLLNGKGENYSKEEILDIYNYVLSENKKYERLYDEQGYINYLDKIRDTNIFQRYEFIKEK